MLSARDRLLDGLVSAVVTAVLLSGFRWGEYLLSRDGVATPHPYLTDSALGLGELAARAVPQDFAVVVLTRCATWLAIPSSWVIPLVLAAGLWWLGIAAAGLVRLVFDSGAMSARTMNATAALAVLAAQWNPYVVERVLQGNWSLIVGAAATMSVVSWAGSSRPSWSIFPRIAAAGLTPTGLIFAAVAGIVGLAARCIQKQTGLRNDIDEPGKTRQWWHVFVLLFASVSVASLPWLLPSIFALGTTVSDASGARAFAARAEPGVGTVGAVVGLGGIWNSGAVPHSRTTLWIVFPTIAAVLVWLVGGYELVKLSRRAKDLRSYGGGFSVARSALLLAGVSIASVTILASGPGLVLYEYFLPIVPGAGIVRDGHKWLALALPGFVICVAACVSLVSRWVAHGRTASAARSFAVYGSAIFITGATTVASVPDAPRALAVGLATTAYSKEWSEVADYLVENAAAADRAAVLPLGTYRERPGANGRVPFLDPAPRWFPIEVIGGGDLLVSGKLVAGEGTTAREIQRILGEGQSSARLAELGVRWIIDEKNYFGPRGKAAVTLSQTTTRFLGSDLALYEVTSAGKSAEFLRGSPDLRAEHWHRWAVIAAHFLWLAALTPAAILGWRSIRRGLLDRRGFR